MPASVAFLAVIVIWSTTPLAIKWSGDGPGFIFGAAARMCIGALLCWLLVVAQRLPLPWHGQARRAYLAAAVGIYGAMLSVYWAAQQIPSGWISVIFGLTPVITGLMASVWLAERALGPLKFLGMGCGLVGLMVIFGRSHSLGVHAALGVGAVALATVLHSASSVWVKRINVDLPALSLTCGALIVSVPLYAITWLVAGQGWPAELSLRAGLSIVYLAALGSVVGFVAYFYVLKRWEAGRVALLTLITPVSALWLGNVFADEPLGPQVWAGTGLIMIGLVFHQWDVGMHSALRSLLRRPAGWSGRGNAPDEGDGR